MKRASNNITIFFLSCLLFTSCGGNKPDVNNEVDDALLDSAIKSADDALNADAKENNADHANNPLNNKSASYNNLNANEGEVDSENNDHPLVENSTSTIIDESNNADNRKDELKTNSKHLNNKENKKNNDAISNDKVQEKVNQPSKQETIDWLTEKLNLYKDKRWFTPAIYSFITDFKFNNNNFEFTLKKIQDDGISDYKIENIIVPINRVIDMKEGIIITNCACIIIHTNWTSEKAGFINNNIQFIPNGMQLEPDIYERIKNAFLHLRDLINLEGKKEKF